ncbi:pyridoxal phosphate-dependent aminotransferase [Clostridium polynesiense]|uniref:pyridoxal phosphate-dependent aminotransferase n=1 Tax=Clostridium polynesiense TaxID=1325933 RepID=UPI00058CFD23|nr:aminotransferase class I/II-fold pyridoxal phosphate-dependent enzyme [Clostridium polynesiense]
MNNNVRNIEISGIRRFFNKVVKVPEAISLTLGQPDFTVPEDIKKAMIDAINLNKTSYTPNAGIYELRKEISSYLLKMNIGYSPEEICITAGGSEALYSTLTALINPGDNLLIPNPGYPAYESIGVILGAYISGYELNSDFTLNIDNIKKSIKDEVNNYLVLSFPSNPTGAVLSEEDVKKLYKLIKENNIIVITDEIYASLSYSSYNSIASYKDIREKIIYVSGFSKMFSMTGLRVGYVCASLPLLKEIIKVHQYNVSCANSIGQYGVLEGLKNSLREVENMKEEFTKRRDYIYNRLQSLGLEASMPQGAFYIFPSIKKFNMNSEEFCERLLYEGKVACVPGSAFGTAGEGHIRISYSYSIEEIAEGLNRIENWINSLK